jgi:hypothetical protein
MHIQTRPFDQFSNSWVYALSLHMELYTYTNIAYSHQVEMRQYPILHQLTYKSIFTEACTLDLDRIGLNLGIGNFWTNAK